MPNNKYNLVAENSQSTVVAEYSPDRMRVAHYQSEADLEKAFIDQLKTQAYDYLPITSETDLKNNLRQQLEKLNDFKFTDNEWERFFTGELANPNQSIEEKTETIQENNTKYFDEDIEGKELLTQDERDEIKQLQARVKASKENERQRLLGFIAEFYPTRVVEPGIKLTVSPFGWLCSEENIDRDREERCDDDLEIKIEKYRAEMKAFTQFMKDKFFA